MVAFDADEVFWVIMDGLKHPLQFDMPQYPECKMILMLMTTMMTDKRGSDKGASWEFPMNVTLYFASV